MSYLTGLPCVTATEHAKVAQAPEEIHIGSYWTLRLRTYQRPRSGCPTSPISNDVADATPVSSHAGGTSHLRTVYFHCTQSLPIPALSSTVDEIPIAIDCQRTYRSTLLRLPYAHWTETALVDGHPGSVTGLGEVTSRSNITNSEPSLQPDMVYTLFPDGRALLLDSDIITPSCLCRRYKLGKVGSLDAVCANTLGRPPRVGTHDREERLRRIRRLSKYDNSTLPQAVSRALEAGHTPDVLSAQVVGRTITGVSDTVRSFDVAHSVDIVRSPDVVHSVGAVSPDIVHSVDTVRSLDVVHSVNHVRSPDVVCSSHLNY